jgi:sulfur relay (sulfurtransferase) DsrC/TusE family protein
MASKLVKRLRWKINTRYWAFVKRFNRKAYLSHVIQATEDLSDCEEYEELLLLETNEWTRRADRVHISVRDIPLSEDATTHWAPGHYNRESYLPYETLRKLKKLVEDAEYERDRRKREGREIWVKYFTAGAAALAALASLANLYFTSRRK